MVRGARPRLVQMASHSAARSCRPRTGHFSSTFTRNRASQVVVPVTVGDDPTCHLIPRYHKYSDPGRGGKVTGVQLCCAHLMRDLQAVWEADPQGQAWAAQMRQTLTK